MDHHFSMKLPNSLAWQDHLLIIPVLLLLPIAFHLSNSEALRAHQVWPSIHFLCPVLCLQLRTLSMPRFGTLGSQGLILHLQSSWDTASSFSGNSCINDLLISVLHPVPVFTSSCPGLSTDQVISSLPCWNCPFLSSSAP